MFSAILHWDLRSAMSARHRIASVSLRFAIGVALLGATLSRGRANEPSTPLTAHRPPQAAVGDFDGDGQVDTAVAGDYSISVSLSGSQSAISFETAVTGIVEGDIDHDGDLDLVAATASGEVLVWLNDGHGRFTQQPARKAPGFLTGAALGESMWPGVLAIGTWTPVATTRSGRIT